MNLTLELKLRQKTSKTKCLMTIDLNDIRPKHTKNLKDKRPKITEKNT